MTVQQFLTCILQDFPSIAASSPEDAIRLGILEDYDTRKLSEPICRRDAARITHEILLRLYEEPDEEDWSSAQILRDLYDCHTCVRHIAQIYAKGILPALDETHFGAKQELSEKDALLIRDRLTDKALRIPPKPSKVNTFSTITFSEISQLPQYILIDVRSASEHNSSPITYQDALFPCENIPLERLHQNPYAVSSDKNIPILLYCKMGYQSTFAAKLLCEYGYTRVFVIKNQ